MLAQRLMQQSTKRALTHDTLLIRSFAPASLVSQQSRLQKRYTAHAPSATPNAPPTTPATPSTAYSILAAQRLNRPIAPHLSIYQAQIPWYLSALNRITGCTVSAGFYIFGFAYLVSPLLGWHLESATLAEWFGGFGGVTKGVMKFGVALPFCFHSLNGVRHLVWDTGREFGNVQVVRTGWAVVGLSVVSAGALATLW